MSVAFGNCDVELTEDDLAKTEVELGCSFPPPLRAHYLKDNGGIPSPYIYRDGSLETAISAALPMKSLSSRRTIVDVYKRLVRALGLVPGHFVPFAVDGGGGYFFCDCSSQEGLVSFYRHDTAYEDKRLLPLGLGFSAFWASLRSDD